MIELLVLVGREIISRGKKTVVLLSVACFFSFSYSSLFWLCDADDEASDDDDDDDDGDECDCDWRR